jgi:hypothetical protein
MSIKKVDDVKHQMIVAFKFALVVNRCINLGFSLKKRFYFVLWIGIHISKVISRI